MLNNINYLLCDAYKKTNTFKRLTEDEFTSLLKTKYSEAVYSSEIYRGIINDVGEYAYTKPKKRVSENTTNVYTRLFSDILPSWSEYPKRSESFICINNSSEAKYYGFVYKIYPINGTKIAICPDTDIWDSFDWTNLNTFNYQFINLLKKIDIYNKFNNKIINIFGEGSNKSIINMLNYFDRIIEDELVNYPYDNDKFNVDLFDNFKKYGIINFLNILFDPDTNKFKLQNIKDLKINANEKHEIWFSAPCLMEYYGQYDEIA